MKIAFFDTKSYWVDAFKPVAAKYGYEITFFNDRLTPATAHLAAGHDATCSFVNDEVPAEVIRVLINLGSKVLLLRYCWREFPNTERHLFLSPMIPKRPVIFSTTSCR